jgi:hypothetical protein
MSAREYRQYADECLSWAKTTQSERDRRDFLRMAEAWLQAAALIEQAPPPAPNDNLRGLNAQVLATRQIARCAYQG